MFYVYVLQSLKDGKFYIGFSSNLKKRITSHFLVGVPATKPRRPLELIFYEAYLDKCDALRREKYFKTNKGKTTLRTMLKKYLIKTSC